jgi:hypothetical protein
MMGYSGYNMMSGGGAGLLGLLTWVLLVVFLALGSMYFWKNLNRKK